MKRPRNGVQALLGAAACMGLIGACGPANEAAAPRRDTAGAVDDLRLVAEWIASAHPRPYQHQSKAEFGELTEELAALLRADEEVTDLKLGAAVRQLLAPLRDGHVAIGVPTFQPGSEVGILPVPLRVLDGQIYVDGDHGELRHGSRVTAIDGRSADIILDELRPLLLSDGTGEAPRHALLDRDFLQLYHLRFGLRATHSFEVEPPEGAPLDGEMPDTHREAITVDEEALPFSQRGELVASRRTEPRWVAHLAEDERGPRLDFVETGIAHLTLPTFAVPEDGAYAGQVAEAFTELLPDAEVLIVDLRGNEGGYRTRGGEVLGHLLGEPFTQWSGYGVRIRTVPEDFVPYVAGLFPDIDETLASFPRRTDDRGLHYRAFDPLADLFVPREPRYSGPLVVLVDGLTASAASETLAALLAARPDTTVIGQETLGPCDEHVGELPVVLTTPNFGVAVLSSLALIDQVDQPDCRPGRGTIPEVVVQPSAQDVILGHDVVLERAIEFAKESSARSPEDEGV